MHTCVLLLRERIFLFKVFKRNVINFSFCLNSAFIKSVIDIIKNSMCENKRKKKIINNLY